MDSLALSEDEKCGKTHIFYKKIKEPLIKSEAP